MQDQNRVEAYTSVQIVMKTVPVSNVRGHTSSPRLTHQAIQSPSSPPTPTNTDEEECDTTLERANSEHEEELMRKRPQQEVLILRYRDYGDVTTENSRLLLEDEADPATKDKKRSNKD